MDRLRRKLTLTRHSSRTASDAEDSVGSFESPSPALGFPDGIEVLFDCPDATVDICFVHGLTGNRNSTWTAHGQSSPWPKMLLPPKLKKARILTYGYDAYITKVSTASSNRLIDHATNLLNDLTTDRVAAGASSRALIFVAHSLGGLVCKEANLMSRNNPDVHLRSIFEHTKGIIFMGTPHQGSWMAELAKIPVSAFGLVKSSNKSLLAILETNDQLLESIQLRFLAMTRDLREGGARRFEITCFFEELPLLLVGKVVSKESATLSGYNPISIHANHSDMVRFSSAGETGFKRVLGELIRWEAEVRDSLTMSKSTANASKALPIGNNETGLISGAIPEGKEGNLEISLQENLQSLAARRDTQGAEDSTSYFVVPYGRNSNFIGRETFLKTLSVKLDIGKRHSRAALVGLGGIGKSQIALEYAYRLHDAAPEVSVFWIHASNTLRFEQGYLQIGMKAKIPGIDDPKQDVKELVVNWLINTVSGKWLIIVDNADDSDVFFKSSEINESGSRSKHLIKYLPQCSHGSIIFTTRNKQAGVHFATPAGVLELPKMSSSDAMNLLKTSLLEDTSDDSVVSKLLELLDYLPLAISQAGSYIAANSISVSTYLQLYSESEASSIELLSEDFEDLQRDPETKNPALVTWQISFIQIRQVNSLAADILSSMACLDRQGILRSILPVNSTVTSIQFSKAIGLLKAYSLITSENDQIFGMHRLIHLATRNWLRLDGTFGDWTRSCLVLVAKTYPSGEHGNLDVCDLHLQHAQFILSYDEFATSDNELRAQLAHKVSYHLRNRGLFSAAYEHADHAVQWREVSLGLHHPDTLMSMDYLARVLHLLGRYETALNMQQRALEWREYVLGPEHPDTLASLNGLGRILYRQGKLDETTESIYQRVLKSRTKVLGAEHPDTISSLDNLARLLHRTNNKKNGVPEEMHRQALEMRTRVLGAEHPKTLSSMNNLALVLWDEDKHEEAEKMHRKVLELRTKILGPEHPEVLASLDNVALALHHQMKHNDGAEGMHRRTLDLRTRLLGPEHPNTLASMNNLIFILYNRGKYDQKAEDLHRRLIELRQKVLGFEHPDTLASKEALELIIADRAKAKWKEQLGLLGKGLNDLSILPESSSCTVSPEFTEGGIDLQENGPQQTQATAELSSPDKDTYKPVSVPNISPLMDTLQLGSTMDQIDGIKSEGRKRKLRRESHNLVERRRRDNINEKIHDLSQLVPYRRFGGKGSKFCTTTSRTRKDRLVPGTLAVVWPDFSVETDRKVGPNKGEILNASVPWIRDLMWLLHLKMQQEEELRLLVEELGGTWPLERPEEENRMYTEFTGLTQGIEFSDFVYSRSNLEVESSDSPDDLLGGYKDGHGDADVRGRTKKRGRKHKYSLRSLSASDASNS